MQLGHPVIFNGGGDQTRLLAFIVDSTDGGAKADLVVLRRGSVEYIDGVPRRAVADYGPEGGGHTWHEGTA